MTEQKLQVVAMTNIPAGSLSIRFPLNLVLAKFNPKKLKLPVQVGISEKGELGILSLTRLGTLKSIEFWPKLIRFAPDCHTQNVKLIRLENGLLILQITKDIKNGQELYLWFDQDLLVNCLQIQPYLSPCNIQGENSYVCTKCGHQFEAPNLLKIHISLNCGQNSIDELWSRLSASQSQYTFPGSTNLSVLPFVPTQQHSQIQKHLPLIIKQIERNSTAQLDLQNNNNSLISPAESFVRTIFQTRTSTSTSTIASSSTLQNNTQQTQRNRNQRTVFHKTIDSEEQAQLESIMSNNMGKGKNGHICLYCGKLYSRKYGLKIHIRTHTGYKPLACNVCHRPFGDPSNLNKHVRLHSEGSTPNSRCEICGKVLVRRRDLERHIQSRHAGLHNSSSSK